HAAPAPAPDPLPFPSSLHRTTGHIQIPSRLGAPHRPPSRATPRPPSTPPARCIVLQSSQRQQWPGAEDEDARRGLPYANNAGEWSTPESRILPPPSGPPQPLPSLSLSVVSVPGGEDFASGAALRHVSRGHSPVTSTHQDQAICKVTRGNNTSGVKNSD
ncbi:unnamed protein product, partial [Urochloa humidicola]